MVVHGQNPLPVGYCTLFKVISPQMLPVYTLKCFNSNVSLPFTCKRANVSVFSRERVATEFYGGVFDWIMSLALVQPGSLRSYHCFTWENVIEDEFAVLHIPGRFSAHSTLYADYR